MRPAFFDVNPDPDLDRNQNGTLDLDPDWHKNGTDPQQEDPVRPKR